MGNYQIIILNPEGKQDAIFTIPNNPDSMATGLLGLIQHFHEKISGGMSGTRLKGGQWKPYRMKWQQEWSKMRELINYGYVEEDPGSIPRGVNR